MRKLIALAVVCTTALVFAAVAFAVNSYKVAPASTKGSHGAKGTAAKPAAKAVVFGFTTAGDKPGDRATPVQKYKIGFQGLKYFGKNKVFPRCSFAKVSQTLESDVEKSCKKAFVGKGVVNNLVGLTGNPATLDTCLLRLRLYNLGTGFALRLDGGSTAKPPTDCPTAINQAINAKFKTVKIGGKSSASLQFTVDASLLHPGTPALSNAIQKTTSTITGKTRKIKIKGKTRKVSILSSVSCGSKRTIQVSFTDEAGSTVPASTKVKC